MDFATLSAAARSAARLGFFGGSFDPPHRGHSFAAAAAARAAALDHVLWVPAAQPPHKPQRKLAHAHERLAMLELLLAGVPGHSIWTGELERVGPSYTIVSVRELRRQLPRDTRIFLILGEDNLAGLPQWKEARALLELAPPIVVARSPSAERARAQELFAGAQFVDALYDASSTELRARLREGRDCSDLLPRELEAYIRARGLYGARR